jgi:hypothetical protein
MLMLHYKSDPFPELKSFQIPLGRNHKRWRTFIRERTQSFKITSSSFQLDKIANNLPTRAVSKTVSIVALEIIIFVKRQIYKV